jgi:hypothetical protein
MEAEPSATVTCVECLRCGHRGAVDADVLRRHGLAPEVGMAELSRSLVCQVCGGRSTRAFRASLSEARTFITLDRPP